VQPKVEKIQKILIELIEDNFEIRNFPNQTAGNLVKSIRVSFHGRLERLFLKRKKIEDCASAGSCNIKTSQVVVSLVNFLTGHLVRQAFNQLKVLKVGNR